MIFEEAQDRDDVIYTTSIDRFEQCHRMIHLQRKCCDLMTLQCKFVLLALASTAKAEQVIPTGNDCFGRGRGQPRQRKEIKIGRDFCIAKRNNLAVYVIETVLIDSHEHCDHAMKRRAEDSRQCTSLVIMLAVSLAGYRQYRILGQVLPTQPWR